MEQTLLAIVLAPLAAAIVAGLFGRVVGRAGAHTVTILGVAISFFFEGLADGHALAAQAQGDMMADKEALELVRSYYAIPEAQRRRLFDLARVLSEAA